MLLQIRSGNNGMMEYWTRSEACAHDVKEKKTNLPAIVMCSGIGSDRDVRAERAQDLNRHVRIGVKP
jgi:hypothetical protein